jgi:hypothetical protein
MSKRHARAEGEMHWRNIKESFDNPDRKSFGSVDKLLRWVDALFAFALFTGVFPSFSLANSLIFRFITVPL